jgi:hypothetical protein
VGSGPRFDSCHDSDRQLRGLSRFRRQRQIQGHPNDGFQCRPWFGVCHR